MANEPLFFRAAASSKAAVRVTHPNPQKALKTGYGTQELLGCHSCAADLVQADRCVTSQLKGLMSAGTGAEGGAQVAGKAREWGCH